MRRIMLLALALVLCAVLCGCGLVRDDSLLNAPDPGGKQQQLLQAVYTYLGSGITLKYPMGGDSSSPFFWWDADGDGTDELLVTYQNTAKSKNVQLALLRPGQGGWYAVHMDVEGVGGEVAGLQALQLNDGQRCLLAAYQDATGRDWTLCFYQWQNGALTEQERLVCQQYAVQSLNDNGCHQIALVQKNDSHGLLQLRVYDGSGQGAGSLLTERSITTLDARFDRCTFMAHSLREREHTLVLDMTDGSGSCLAEVVTWRQDRFIRCYTPDNVNIPNLSARSFMGLEPMDIDGDGAMEVPCVESRVVAGGTDQESAGTRFYFVSWYAVSAQNAQLQGYSLVDTTAGCLMQLPTDWCGRVMLQPVGGSVWSLRGIQEGGELLSFQADATGRTPAGYTLLGDLGRRQIYIQMNQALSAEDSALITEGFCPLY